MELGFFHIRVVTRISMSQILMRSINEFALYFERCCLFTKFRSSFSRGAARIFSFRRTIYHISVAFFGEQVRFQMRHHLGYSIVWLRFYNQGMIIENYPENIAAKTIFNTHSSIIEHHRICLSLSESAECLIS